MFAFVTYPFPCLNRLPSMRRILALLVLVAAPLAAQSLPAPGTYTVVSYENSSAGIATHALPVNIPVSSGTVTLNSATIVIVAGSPSTYTLTYKVIKSGESSETTLTESGTIRSDAIHIGGNVNGGTGGDVYGFLPTGTVRAGSSMLKERVTGDWYLVESHARMKLSYAP